MLYYHRNASDQLSKEIDDRLSEMSAAHRVIPTVDESYLMENDKQIRSREAILAYLDGHEIEVSTPHNISADSCRIDPETGKVC